MIVEREELVDASQNRIVNVTFLVPGETEIAIPVSRAGATLSVCAPGRLSAH